MGLGKDCTLIMVVLTQCLTFGHKGTQTLVSGAVTRLDLGFSCFILLHLRGTSIYDARGEPTTSATTVFDKFGVRTYWFYNLSRLNPNSLLKCFILIS